MYFNIFHLAAHGASYRQTKNKLDYSLILSRRGRHEVEIFAPEMLVRLQIDADVLLSTCCDTFSPPFVELIKGYDNHIGNFIAPVSDSWPGDATVFSIMFYNRLLSALRPPQKKISDSAIVEAFTSANRGYKSYGGNSTFRLYSFDDDKTYE